MVAEKHAEKLIIDMCQNGGGDYFEGLRHLVEPIRRLTDINKKDHLFVLIGPQTFCAAMANASRFRRMTEHAGRKDDRREPESYQEPREFMMFTLPRHRPR